MHGAMHTLLCVAYLSAAAAVTTNGYADQNGGTTGGAGGTTVYVSTGTQIHQALCSRSSSSSPITIYVQGTITVGGTSKVSGNSCNTADGKIELKEISNVSIIGYGSGAIFDQIGIHIRSSSNIILQNLHVKNVKKSGSVTSNGGDAIGMENNVHNVWVDHCTLEASGGESQGYDGLCDMKSNTKYVTVSYCRFLNSGRGGLVGSSDSDLNNGPVTYHHNYYNNIESRIPLLRAATAHSYNNYFLEIGGSAINSRAGARIRVENNYFKNTNNPLGTFYTSLTGYWHASGNVLDNVDWSSGGAGNSMASTTTMSIPYSYAADPASCIPTVVLSTAGAYTNRAVSSGCSGSGSGSSSVTINDAYYVLRNKYSGLYLDVTDGATANGANVQQWEGNGCTCQQWRITHVGNGYHRILNVNSGRVLDVSGSSTEDGGNIIQYLWNQGSNQQWKIYNHNGYYAFVNRHSNKAMDVFEWSTANGGNVCQYDYWGGDVQLWSLQTY